MTTTTRPISEIISDIMALPDEAQIELPENYGMPQRAEYTWCHITNPTVRPMTSAGIPRDLIVQETSWREVNAGRSRFPRTFYLGRVNIPHVSGIDNFDCTCGCIDLISELAQAANDAGFTARYDGRTHWNDR